MVEGDETSLPKSSLLEEEALLVVAPPTEAADSAVEAALERPMMKLKVLR